MGEITAVLDGAKTERQKRLTVHLRGAGPRRRYIFGNPPHVETDAPTLCGLDVPYRKATPTYVRASDGHPLVPYVWRCADCEARA